LSNNEAVGILLSIQNKILANVKNVELSMDKGAFIKQFQI